ncbi:hypothetical protein PMAYCL1PPCAC_32852, partial [Pristionchus mayeri]
VMRVILAIVFIQISYTLAAEHSESLFCFSERTGVLFDEPYDDPRQSKNCGNTTYCQKITANYISVGDKRTHIVLKGCDGIEVSNAFYGPKCQNEGCYEITLTGEKYSMCCCKGNHCNSATRFAFLYVLYITLLRILT